MTPNVQLGTILIEDALWKSSLRKLATGRETWPSLSPFASGRIQDRGNGNNLCRPHRG
jgi:hypothetical protein